MIQPQHIPKSGLAIEAESRATAEGRLPGAAISPSSDWAVGTMGLLLLDHEGNRYVTCTYYNVAWHIKNVGRGLPNVVPQFHRMIISLPLPALKSGRATATL